MNRTIVSLLSESESNRHRELLQRIKNKSIRPQQQIKLLQGLREVVRTDTESLAHLRKYYKERQENKISKIKIKSASEPTEEQLWRQLDFIESKIIENREEKIGLNNVLQGYEDELLEQNNILDFRKQSLKKLKLQIDRKRMEVQKHQQRQSSTMTGGTSPSLTGSLSSPRFLSPRMMMSPRNIKNEIVRMLWK